MQLKVCECCGKLFIRSDKRVYCDGCKVVLADWPAPRGKRATGRKPKNKTEQK